MSLADAQAQAAYPQMAWALSDPELGPILRAAAAAGWGAQRIQGAIQNTQWYKQHNQAARAWADLSANDPGEAASRVNAQELAIKNAGAQEGAQLTPGQVQQLAIDSLTNGWNPTELTQHINNYVSYASGQEIDLSTGRRAYYGPNGEPGGPGADSGSAHWVQPDGTTVYYTPGNMRYGDPNRAANTPGAQPYSMGQPGQIGVTMADLRRQAAAYLVPMSDPTLFQWAREIGDGRTDAHSFTTYLEQLAESLHPEAAAALKAGQTTALYYEPYRQKAASLLEINPDSIDWMDPKWGNLLTTTDPKTGQRSATPFPQFENTLRTDPQFASIYDQTTQAKQQAASFNHSILTSFGAI